MLLSRTPRSSLRRSALSRGLAGLALYQPPDTQHGFHNDTTLRYDEDAAREAWRRTTELFGRTLREKAA